MRSISVKSIPEPTIMLSMKLHHLPFGWKQLSPRSFQKPPKLSVKIHFNYQRKARQGCGKPVCLKAGQEPFDSDTTITLRESAPIRQK
jgi:hypothetical protein